MRFSTAKAGDAGRQPPDAALHHLASHLRFWLVACAVLALDLWSKNWVFDNLAADRTHTLIPGIIELRRSLNDGAVFGSLTGYVGLFIAASVFALGFVSYLFACSGSGQRALHVALGMILAGALGNLYDRAVTEADVVIFKSPSGRERTLIGRIIEPPAGHLDNDEAIYVGSWPDGSRPQRFDKSEVSVRSQGVVRDFIKFTPEFPTWVPWLGKRRQRDVWPWVFNVADSALVCGVAALLLSSWLETSNRKRA